MTGPRAGGLAGGLAVVLLTASPPARLPAQDTNAIDRGVRIGIVYRPGVRPGMVMLPRKGLDSISTIAIASKSSRSPVGTRSGLRQEPPAVAVPRRGVAVPRLHRVRGLGVERSLRSAR